MAARLDRLQNRGGPVPKEEEMQGRYANLLGITSLLDDEDDVINGGAKTGGVTSGIGKKQGSRPLKVPGFIEGTEEDDVMAVMKKTQEECDVETTNAFLKKGLTPLDYSSKGYQQYEQNKKNQGIGAGVGVDEGEMEAIDDMLADVDIDEGDGDEGEGEVASWLTALGGGGEGRSVQSGWSGDQKARFATTCNNLAKDLVTASKEIVRSAQAELEEEEGLRIGQDGKERGQGQGQGQGQQGGGRGNSQGVPLSDAESAERDLLLAEAMKELRVGEGGGGGGAKEGEGKDGNNGRKGLEEAGLLGVGLDAEDMDEADKWVRMVYDAARLEDIEEQRTAKGGK